MSPEEPSRKQHLLLFVAGTNPISEAARIGVEELCATSLTVAFELQLVDMLEDFEVAQSYGIYVTPTLVWQETNRRVLGDLTVPIAVSQLLGLNQN